MLKQYAEIAVRVMLKDKLHKDTESHFTSINNLIHKGDFDYV